MSSAATVSGATVYVTSMDGRLYSLDTDSGSRRWAFNTGSSIWASPSVANDTVYIASLDGQVHAVDAATGRVRWRFKTGDKVWSSPIAANNTVLVGSDDNLLYALDGLSGGILWKHTTTAAIRGSAIVGGDTVYVGSFDDFVYALDIETGELRWKSELGGSTLTTPVLQGGLLYTAASDERVYALDAETGALKWNYWTADRVFSSPAVADGVVYIGSDGGHLYALHAKTGRLRWRFEADDKVRSTPAVIEDIVYVGSLDGSLYALDADSGALLWKFETRGPVWSSPAISAGTVYIGSNDNHLYALKAGAGTLPLARPAPSAIPIATSPFVPMSPAELKAKLELVFSTDVNTIGEARVSSGGEVRTFIRDYSEDVLAIFDTGYHLLMGLTPREDGWIPRILSADEYELFIDENEGGDVDLKLALAFCCHRTSEGLELIINGSAPLPAVISSLAHEAGHARQMVLNPVQAKFRRASNVGAIREAQAYSFQAALVRMLGEYAGMNTTKVPVHSTAARYFDGWRVLWRDQFDDVTLEHQRGVLMLWLGALHDPLLAEARAELTAQHILSPSTLLALHNRLIELTPAQIDRYIPELHAYFTDDFNLIGGTLARRKGEVRIEGFVEHAAIVFVIP